MTLLWFVRRWRYRVCNFPGGVGGQCVDLANQYLQEIWHQPPQHRNAIDWARIALPAMRWVPNSPTNTPPAGSLVVWGQYPRELIGANGHIAIAVYAETMDLLTFDQNWPDAAPCGLVTHDYGGVLGWHQPAG